ncbi:MAG: phosphate/phosphite/phosphonate ABC transporter substrate-binding protein [Coriobacteriia bacterium]
MDIAFLCAHHYVDLLDQDACVGIATPIIDGSSATRHLLVVRAEDPVEDFVSLKGSKFAVSDKSSLGGFAYLSYLTAQLGVKPAQFCGELTLGESQNQNMRAVLQGKARATVVSTAQIGSWDMSKFRIVEESESIGCPPVVADSGVDPELVARIREILVSCDTAALLGEPSAIDGFKALDPAEYEFAYTLRDACGHHLH